MLKKLIAIAAVSIAAQGVAFAGALPTGLTFKPSANVGTDYATSGTAGTATAQDYYIVTKHSSGDRIFASSNATSNIYFKKDDAWKGKALSDNPANYTAPTAGESTFTGWEVSK